MKVKEVAAVIACATVLVSMSGCASSEQANDLKGEQAAPVESSTTGYSGAINKAKDVGADASERIEQTEQDAESTVR